MSVCRIWQIWNQRFNSSSFCFLAEGERRPSQFEKGPQAMIVRLRELARRRISWAARSWEEDEGVGGEVGE